MSITYIPQDLRRKVRSRADKICEYCGLVELEDWVKHQIDHVIAEKHGGATIYENLALACVDCNCHKGTDLSSVKWPDEEIVNLFNPRRDQWNQHFSIDASGKIIFKSPVGEVTTKLLKFNESLRIALRIA